MKVLLVSGSFPPMRCGVGDYAGSLASALTRYAGATVTVLTSESDGPSTTEGGVDVLRTMRSWHARSLGPFHAALQQARPDLVHIQFPTQGYDNCSGLAAIAFQARMRRRLPVVATLHEFLPRTTFRSDRWIHALAVLANRIVVVRPNYYASMPWPLRLVVPSSKVSFVGNASALPIVDLRDAERQAAQQELGGTGAVIAFFGFSFPHKGVDLLFQIADPARHRLLLIGHLSVEDPYHQRLRALAEADAWKGKVTVTGFVDPARAARLLALADAAVFPYRTGGGIWNSSLHAASSQGTFALTTATDRNGYDSAANIYYAKPDDLDEMRRALLQFQGIRGRLGRVDSWNSIAQAHGELYASLTTRGPRQ